MKSFADRSAIEASAIRSGLPFGPYSSGLATNAVFNPSAFGGAQIAQVGRHHHHFGGLEIEEVSSGQIDLAIRLVMPDQLGAENAVPRQSGMFGHRRHQRDVAVRQRRDRELLLQPRQPADRVRPRPQPMPRAIERIGLRAGEAGDLELDENLVEDHPMQVVEPGPRQLAGADAVHARAITTAPGIGELRAVHAEAFRVGEVLDFLRHR